MAEEDLIFGIWTKEKFIDNMIFGIFTALIGFITGIGYKFLSDYLEQHKWFEEEK